MGSNPGWGRSPGVGNGNPLYSSILARKSPTDRGTWWVQSMGLQRVGHIWAHKHRTFYLEVKTKWSHFCLCKLIFYSLDRHIQINSENVLNIVDIKSKLSIKFKHIFYIHDNDLRERENVLWKHISLWKFHVVALNLMFPIDHYIFFFLSFEVIV